MLFPMEIIDIRLTASSSEFQHILYLGDQAVARCNIYWPVLCAEKGGGVRSHPRLQFITSLLIFGQIYSIVSAVPTKYSHAHSWMGRKERI